MSSNNNKFERRSSSWAPNNNDDDPEALNEEKPADDQMGDDWDLNWGPKEEVERRRSILSIREGHEPIYEDTPMYIFNKRFSKELAAWYLYDWGMSAFGGFAMTFVIPIFLLFLAEVKANDGDLMPYCNAPQILPDGSTYDIVCEIDKTNLSNSYCVQGVNRLVDHAKACQQCLPGFGYVYWSGNRDLGFASDPTTMVPFLGFEVNYVSFFTYIVSIAILLQGITFITVAPYADCGKNRKWMFSAAVIGGSSACVLLFFASGDMGYFIGAILVIIAAVLFGLANVCYNSYLPIIVAAHPRIALQFAHPTKEESHALEMFYEEHESNVSMIGFTVGYIGQLLLMLIVLVVIRFSGANNQTDGFFGFRLGLVVTGGWWLFFSLPGVYYIKPRPGPPLHTVAPQFTRKLFYGFIHTYRCLSHCLKYKDVIIYLVSYGIYSDMVGTVTYTGILFAKEELCFGVPQLTILALINLLGAIFGGIFFMLMKNFFGLTTKTIILICLSIYGSCTIYGITGIFTTSIGLYSPYELYFFAFTLGTVTGVIQGNSRALFADFTPKGKEAMFFSIYQLTDKLTNWVGPFVVGQISEDAMTNKRWTFVYLFSTTLIAAILLIFFVDLRRGVNSAGRNAPQETTENDSEELTSKKAKNPGAPMSYDLSSDDASDYSQAKEFQKQKSGRTESKAASSNSKSDETAKRSNTGKSADRSRGKSTPKSSREEEATKSSSKRRLKTIVSEDALSKTSSEKQRVKKSKSKVGESTRSNKEINTSSAEDARSPTTDDNRRRKRKQEA